MMDKRLHNLKKARIENSYTSVNQVVDLSLLSKKFVNKLESGGYFESDITSKNYNEAFKIYGKPLLFCIKGVKG